MTTTIRIDGILYYKRFKSIFENTEWFMMIKMNWIIYILTFSAISLTSKAQTTDLPINYERFWRFDVRSYNPNWTMPRDSFRDDGQPYIIYRKEAEQLIRQQYYKFGGLQSECEIAQILVSDTTAIRDYDTQELKIAIYRNWIDRPIGKYTEYYESWHDQRIKVTGHFNVGKRVGEWISYDEKGNKSVVTYNDEGRLDGPYQEFYWSQQDSTYNKKVEGQYGVKEYKVFNQKGFANDTFETRRTGIWKYYSKNGLLLETSEYKWQMD